MGSFALVARRAFLGFIVAGLSFTAVRAGNPDAEAFAQRLADEGVAILKDTADPNRRAKFRDFVTQYADARRTAQFTLGAYWRTTSEPEREAFIQAFKDFATAVYESRLDQYRGQTLKVTGSLENKPGDITVNTIIVDPNARQPIRVAFRLLGGGGAYRFVDIQVEGIWLSIDQRDQFAAFLSQHGGSVPALTAHLQRQAQQIMAGGR